MISFLLLDNPKVGGCFSGLFVHQEGTWSSKKQRKNLVPLYCSKQIFSMYACLTNIGIMKLPEANENVKSLNYVDVNEFSIYADILGEAL